MSRYPDFVDPPKKSESWKWTMPLVAVGIIVSVIAIAIHRRPPAPVTRDTPLLSRIEISFAAMPRFIATRYVMAGSKWKQTTKEYFNTDRWRIDRADGEVLINVPTGFYDWVPSLNRCLRFRDEKLYPTGEIIQAKSSRRSPWGVLLNSDDFLINTGDAYFDALRPVLGASNSAFDLTFSTVNHIRRAEVWLNPPLGQPILIRDSVKLDYGWQPISEVKISYPSFIDPKLFDSSRLQGKPTDSQAAHVSAFSGSSPTCVQVPKNGPDLGIQSAEMNAAGFLFLLHPNTQIDRLTITDQTGNVYVPIGAWNSTPNPVSAGGHTTPDLTIFARVGGKPLQWPVGLSISGPRNSLTLSISTPIHGVAPGYCFWLGAPDDAAKLERWSLKGLANYFQAKSAHEDLSQHLTDMRVALAYIDRYISGLVSDGDDDFEFRMLGLSGAFSQKAAILNQMHDLASASKAMVVSDRLAALAPSEAAP